MRDVWVTPPSLFTGIWITYYANGRASHKIDYKDGTYSGEFIAFNPDGSKSYIQHYDHHLAEGKDTGYYPSGRVKYKGVYKAGKRIGIWKWYNKDGSIQSTQDYSKP